MTNKDIEMAIEAQANTTKALGQLEEALGLIKERDVVIAAMDRNILILHEIVTAANETLSEFYKITSTYHKKIIMKTATLEDIKECSNIVQRSIKHFKEMRRLQQHYDKICRNYPDQDISVIKK